jgi:hypothetical protein
MGTNKKVTLVAAGLALVFASTAWPRATESGFHHASSADRGTREVRATRTHQNA